MEALLAIYKNKRFQMKLCGFTETQFRKAGVCKFDELKPKTITFTKTNQPWREKF